MTGAAEDALLLPALSSISGGDEMLPLAGCLGDRLRCRVIDWAGFGAEPSARPRSLSPAVLDRFLDEATQTVGGRQAIGIAAGHGATYLARAARRHPTRFAALVLIAPTWRGPLPTMTQGRRPTLCRRIRTALETPVVGPLLYGVNLSRPVVRWMMREHVYGDPARVTPDVVEAKLRNAHRPGARFATAAFVTGGLDPVPSRETFLATFSGGLPPTLMLRPRNAPRRSGAEMEALAATGGVDVVAVGGALAPHEERPDEVAACILAWLSARPQARTA